MIYSNELYRIFDSKYIMISEGVTFTLKSNAQDVRGIGG